jgi:leucyl aminopeptidase
MKLRLSFILSLILFIYSVSHTESRRTPQENESLPIHKRLIQQGSPFEQPMWLTEEEIHQLAAEKKNFIDITDHVNVTILPRAQVIRYPTQPTQQAVVNRITQTLNIDNLRTTLEKLSSFYTRYYNSDTGVQSAQYIFDTLNAYAGNRTDISINYFPHTWKQSSIIARIQGQTNPSELVVLGAHQDSINGATGRAPGADDDGSGTVTILETFRALVANNYAPNRTIEFHFYSAEEVGLRGSQAIASQYQSDNANVIAALQMDMTLYAGANGNAPIGLVNDYVDPSLTQFIRLMLQSYVQLKWAESNCGYGCSDHASWTRYGYPSAFPFETPFGQHNPNIHTAQDLTSFLTFPRGIEFAKLATGYLVELAATNNTP